MNNGYNPEQFDTEETVGDINQLISRGSGIVNTGRNVVGGAKSAIRAADPLGKRNKNDEKDVAAINNRQKNNDGVNRRPRNKDDENNNKDKKTSEESKTQSSNGKQSALEDKNKLDDSKKSKNNNDDKSKINDKVDKSKKDDGLKKGLGNKTNDKKKNKLKPNKKENLEVELAKKAKKIKVILAVLKIVGLIALPVIAIIMVVILIAGAIMWVKENIPGADYFIDYVIPIDLDISTPPYTGSGSSTSYNYGSSSSFKINGKEYSGKIKVRLYKNDRFELVYSDDRLIDFDKYILGVAYQEVGGGTDSVSEQVFKTQAIAARSYALTRGIGMPDELKITEENGYIVVNIRQTTSDQAYCDPDLGYYAGQLNNCSSGHPKLSADSPLRKWAQEVEGLVLVDSKGNVVNTPYINVDQNKWRSMANNGMKYDEILIKHYDSANNGYTIKKIGVSSTDAESWKQCDSRWGNLKVRSSTICKIGCALTSVSIQIARSGTNTNVSGEFNPGTFMQLHRDNGGFGANDSITWNVTDVAPNFKFNGSTRLGGTKQQKMQKINEYLSNGEYIVLGVSYTYTGEYNIDHYVAVDHVGNDEIYVFDPAGKRNGTLFADYSAMANSNQNFQVLRYKLEG